jgi:two-component system OmpR family response regulator
MLILHLDDDPDIRIITKYALVDFGSHDVVQGENGRSGIEALEGGLKPDLYLLDVMMPDMGGEEFLAIVRARPEWSAPPAIFMTARAQDKELALLRTKWDAGVIVKPFEPMSLSKRIEDMVSSGLKD